MNNKELIKQRIKHIETILQDTNLIDFIAINLSGNLYTKVAVINKQISIKNCPIQTAHENNIFIFEPIEEFNEYEPNDLYYHVISILEKTKTYLNKQISE